MKNKRSVTRVTLLTLGFYLMGAFVMGDWNSGNWPISVKLAMVFFYGCFVIGILAYIDLE